MFQKTNLVKITGFILISFLAVSGVVLGTRIWDPVWNPFRPNPERVMAEMFLNLRNLKSFHSEAEIEFLFKREIGEDMVFYSSAIRDLDNHDSENPKSATDITARLGIEGIDLNFAGSQKTIGDSSFYKITTIPALPFLEPFLQMMGINIYDIKDKWIEIDLESFSAWAKENIPSTYFTSEEELKRQLKEQEVIREEVKQIIETKKIYYVEKELPDEKINGKDVYHYIVALDKEELKNVIPEILETLEGNESDFSSVGSFSEYGSTAKLKEMRIKSYMREMNFSFDILRYMDYSFSEDHPTAYSDLSCDYSEDIALLCEGIVKETGSEPIMFSSPDKYCAYTSLPYEGYYYCISNDLETWKGRVTENPQESGYCDGNTFVCPPEVEIPKEIREKTEKEYLTKSIDEFFEKTGPLTGHIWIGKKDVFPYKLSFEKEFDLNKFDLGEGAVVLKTDIEFSNFNQPINIQPPEDSKSLEDILSPFLEQQQDYYRGGFGVLEYYEIPESEELAYELRVISPNEGEKWISGKEYDIKWCPENLHPSGILPYYYIYLVDDLGRERLIYERQASGGPGSTCDAGGVSLHRWKAGQLESGVVVLLAEYNKIRVKLADYRTGAIIGQGESDGYFEISSSKSSAISCTDSDWGKNYYRKGTVSGHIDKDLPDITRTLTDYCIGSDRLREYSCFLWDDGSKTIDDEIIKCDYGCRNGACQEEMGFKEIGDRLAASIYQATYQLIKDTISQIIY